MYEKVKEDFIDAIMENNKEGFEKVDDKWTEDYISIED